MQIALGVEAVANEAMATSRTAAAVQNRTAQTQFGNQRIGPRIVAHRAFGPIADVVPVVVEIGGQGRLALVDGGATIDGGIAHVHTDTAMVHQCGHGVLLLCRRGRGQAVGHIGPVVAGVGKVGRLNAVARIVAIGMAALAESGVVPILHHLCHGGGHTAGHGVAGAIHVIG